MTDVCMNHIEKYWKSLIHSNTILYNKGDFEQALLGYKEALYRAEVLNNHIPDCIRLKIPFIQVYIISCNNVANTYEKLGQLENSGNILKKAVYNLLQLTSSNKGVTIDSIQPEIKKILLNYMRLVNKIPTDKHQPS